MKFSEYIEKNPNKLLIVPILLFIVSIGILGFNYSQNGYLIDRDISLKGGLSATIYNEDVDISYLESELRNNFPGVDISVRQISSFTTQVNTGIIIESTTLTNEELQPFLEELLGISLTDNYSVEETGSALGEAFFSQMIKAIIFAFILMGIVVLITFRKLIPSLAVILSAFLDIFATFAIISLLGYKLSGAGIAAFLMVIGYSIDTDILLTTRLIKRNHPALNLRIREAMKTGLTMTITTVIALSVALFVTNSIILKQMFSIIVIALIIDILSTWMMNAPLLIKYMRKKNENI